MFKFFSKIFGKQKPKNSVENIDIIFHSILKDYFPEDIIKNFNVMSFDGSTLKIQCISDYALELNARQDFFVKKLNQKLGSDIVKLVEFTY